MLILGRGIDAPSPPNGGVVGFLVVLGAFLNCAVSVGMQYNLGVLLSSFARDSEFSRGYSVAALSWFGSLESALFLLFALPAGFLIDRIGARATSFTGVISFLLGLMLSSVAPNIPTLIAVFSFFVGMGGAFISVAGIVHVQKVFTTRRASASGLAVSGGGAGAAVLGPLIQYAVDKSGWRQAMIVLAVLCALAALVGTVLLIPVNIVDTTASEKRGDDPAGTMHKGASEWHKGASEWYGFTELPGESSSVAQDTGSTEPDEPTSDESTKPPSPSPAPSQKASISEIMKNPIFARYLLAVIAFGSGHFVILTHFNRAVRESGTNAADAAYLITLQGASNMAGRIFIGFFADAVSKRISKIGLLQICFASVSIASVVMAIPAAGSSFLFQAIFMFVHGALGSSVASLQGPIACDLIGIENVSVGFSVVNAIQSPMTAIIPPLAGALRDVTGSYTAVWILVAVNVFASVCALGLLPAGVGGPLTCCTIPSMRGVRLGVIICRV